MAALTIAQYIDQFDAQTRARLETVLELVRTAVPDETSESIKWRMPAFMLGNEPLFFVTGAKRHLTFYPTNETIGHFASELAPYETTEHAIRFPLAKPLPVDLIRDLIDWRLAQLAPSEAP